MHQIQVTMDRAGTKKGEARFTDYMSTLAFEGLPVLKGYIQTYRRENMFNAMGLPYTEFGHTVSKENFYNTEGADGSGIVEWKKNNMEVSRGKRVDYDGLGINPSTIDLKGYDVNYTMKDGNFIIFKDNPDLKYFTQNAEQGVINYYAAKGTWITANFLGTLAVGRIGKYSVDKINTIKNVVNKIKINPNVKGVAKHGASYTIQDKIPVWNKIVGTSVPKIGSKEVILYISDNDGKTWDGKVRFEVHADGGITSKEF
ncbi:hypothetical protein KK120_16530 [Virgibacillus dakarensis]|uniref:hypothetical protein n=1 Tax=Lentibacillus populi TaxID=1827502 RepID=UPI000C83ADB2|nr:hypothetical protein [Lentibacillus populi]MBT2217429.1 hypothetical protein [Virgibacillus dakarensis]